MVLNVLIKMSSRIYAAPAVKWLRDVSFQEIPSTDREVNGSNYTADEIGSKVYIVNAALSLYNASLYFNPLTASAAYIRVFIFY